MLLGPQGFLYCLFALVTAEFSLGSALGKTRAVSQNSSAITAQASPLDFSNSKWIWTTESTGGIAPVGSRAFRKSFTAPEGKNPVSADILITADDDFTLYVNEALTGSGTFGVVKRFCVPLRSCLNVFAVNATNNGGAPNPAGIIATIRVTYTDGTTTTVVTDTTWRAATSLPTGFEKLTLDDNSWGAAIVQPFDTNVPIPADSPPAVSLSNSSWIWTNEVANGVAPAGARAFRRTFVAPSGQVVTSANILIIADDQYSLYVNGKFIGTGTDFTSAQRFTVDLQRASDVLFAVYGVNAGTAPNPAGLLVAIQINTVSDCYCTTVSQVISDSTWKSNTGVPAGFQLPGFDDSKWPGVTVQGLSGIRPWGAVSVPTGVSPPGSPLPGAPPGV